MKGEYSLPRAFYFAIGVFVGMMFFCLYDRYGEVDFYGKGVLPYEADVSFGGVKELDDSLVFNYCYQNGDGCAVGLVN